MGKKITIYDLAQELQVSPATVSRALNNHPSISIATRKRVVDFAKSAGYRTNKFAVNLSRQKSNTLGVIVPRLDSYFMSTVLAGIEKIANTKGYNLIISQSLESEAKEKINAKTLYESGVDALLISLASETSDYGHIELFSERKIPLLFFDRVYEIQSAPTILINNKEAAKEATEHLIHQGCKNILHVSGSLKRNVYSDRLLGFIEALEKNNLQYHKNSLFETNLATSEIDKLIAYIQNSVKKIDGIFLASDNMAVQLIKELKKLGHAIPRDIKIVGFNNDPVSEIISPTLTTINYPGYEMGILAGESIISHLNGNINLQTANTILLKHELIIRESSVDTKS